MSENTILSAADIPEEISAVRQLDFTTELLASRITKPWVAVATWRPRRTFNSVESFVRKESLLVAPDAFERLFDSLEAVGNVLHGIGEPGGAVLHGPDGKSYDYVPIHRFEFPFTNETGEPLVFFYATTAGQQKPFINPDILFYFNLEERPPGSGSWWDPRQARKRCAFGTLTGKLT